MSHLLVIDDDPLFRTLITRAAATVADEVSTASDGHEGYQAALKVRPDLVLLDLLMPTWDGVQTLRAFRSDDSLANVPVVIVSGSLDSDELYAACELGVSGVLAKSEFSKEGLVKVIDRLLVEFEDPNARRSPGDSAVMTVPLAAQHFDA